jgi:1-acyl-sn-glycerol-3-phosphate acyltransferase
MRTFLRTLFEALFRVLFTYDCLGEEKLPAEGPAVVAANHPSYLDPMLLSLQVERPIHFMAWDALFKVPFVGFFIRLFGAFPVDIRRGKGQEAYARAKALVESGQIVGIFPEGRRSQTAWMEPELRSGAARLAWETGAPLYPATIVGAFRAWPHTRLLPHTARVRVRYHDPIDPTPFRALPEEQALPALLAELRRRVERSLLPGVKADRRFAEIYRRPSPFPRWHEFLPPLLLSGLVFWRTRDLLAALPAYAYLAYLLADHALLPQTRTLKWLRNASPLLFLALYGPRVLSALGLPALLAPGALAAILAGALYPYLYDRGRTALAFIRGLTFTLLLGLGATWVWPSPLGLHVSAPLFAAAFAWERETVFWRSAVPVLLGYAVGVPVLLHGGAETLAHALVGLLGWLLARLGGDVGGDVEATPAPADEAPGTLSLRL